MPNKRNLANFSLEKPYWFGCAGNKSPSHKTYDINFILSGLRNKITEEDDSTHTVLLTLGVHLLNEFAKTFLISPQLVTKRMIFY